jgi:hypothetical protein
MLPRVAVEFARHASWLALSSVGAVVVFLSLPLVFLSLPFMTPYYIHLAWVQPTATIAFVIPFTEGGVCITLLLTRLPYGGGWLYAADLVGAALGCLGLILALLVVDPVTATFWIGAFAAGAGWIVVWDSDVARRRINRNVAIALAAAAAVHTGLCVSGKEHLRVLWAKC